MVSQSISFLYELKAANVLRLSQLSLVRITIYYVNFSYHYAFLHLINLIFYKVITLCGIYLINIREMSVLQQSVFKYVYTCSIEFIHTIETTEDVFAKRHAFNLDLIKTHLAIYKWLCSPLASRDKSDAGDEVRNSGPSEKNQGAAGP